MKSDEARYGVTRRNGAWATLALAGLILTTVLVPAMAEGAAETNADAAPDGAIELDVGYMPILPVAQSFVMEQEGWTAEAGLTFNMVRFQNGPAMVQAVASGELDVMFFGIGPAMVARGRGEDIKVVAASIVEQIAFIAGGELASAWDSADPVASLRGFAAAGGRPVRIATFPEGSVPHTVLLYWLSERLGIDTATRDEFVEIVPMGADQVQQALLAGQVDGASILEPTLTIVRELAPETRVLARAPEMFPGQPGAVLAVRESVIRDHPEAVQRLVDLHVRATEFLNTRPEESARHALAYIGAGLVEVETLEAAITSPSTNYTADPREIVEPTRRMHDFQLAQGSLAQPVDLDALFESRFYEAAVAE